MVRGQTTLYAAVTPEGPEPGFCCCTPRHFNLFYAVAQGLLPA